MSEAELVGPWRERAVLRRQVAELQSEIESQRTWGEWVHRCCMMTPDRIRIIATTEQGLVSLLTKVLYDRTHTLTPWVPARCCVCARDVSEWDCSNHGHGYPAACIPCQIEARDLWLA